MAEQAGDAIWIVNADGYIDYANTAAASLFGVTHKALIGSAAGVRHGQHQP